jgi:hypothetical protein
MGGDSPEAGLTGRRDTGEWGIRYSKHYTQAARAATSFSEKKSPAERRGQEFPKRKERHLAHNPNLGVWIWFR